MTELVLQGLFETLWMVVPSALLGQALGTLLGLWLVSWHPASEGARPTGYRALGALVNAARSLPFVIVLVLVIPLSRLLTGTSIGATAAIVPLTLSATPFIARLVEAALLEVPRGVVDAARAFGATHRQVLLRVLLPEALPALVRGFTLALVSLLGYSAMAGAIGGGGLGDLAIRYGYQRFEAGILVATVVSLIALVQLAQSVGDRVAQTLDRRVSHGPRSRRWPALAAAVVCVLALAFFARSEQPTSQELRVLRVGASPTPQAEILEVVRPMLAQRGVDLQIRVFNDYVHPNLALGDGSIDANFFQHRPYLAEFQKTHPLGIVASTQVFVAPMALYSKRVKSLSDIPAGASIAIPNDPSNSGRALLLLQKAGLLVLAPGASIHATINDVRENPKQLVLRELDAAQLPHALPDVSAAVLNTNYALQAGLSPTRDGLIVEAADSPYANVLAAKPSMLDRPEFVALQEALTSAEVRAFILKRFEGSILPVF